jgi:thiol-disulfide isomerase/thioredoxin
VRSWASDTLLGGTRRGILLRVGLAVGLLAVAFWALPSRRADDGTGHHGTHAPSLDAFERAGVTEFTEGQRGPALRLARFPDGAAVSLEAFADKLVVLNFWATWCGPCVRELPSLQRLAARLPAGRARVVVVSQDRDGFERVTPFLVQRAIDIAASYVDERLGFSHAAGVSALPTTILLGPDGRELGRLIGAAEWDSPEAQALIGHYLAK